MNFFKKNRSNTLIRFGILSMMFLIVNISTVFAQVSPQERQALIDFYNSTDGPNWTNNTNWLTETPVSSWFGVTVVDDKVVGVSFSNNGLDGVIPDSFGDLIHLQNITIFINRIRGPLPDVFDTLVNVESFILERNAISGNIPPSIGNMTALKVLNFGSNGFTGSIPASLGNLSNLTNLSLFANQLSGSIPPSLGNLSSLERLILFRNTLEGEIPSEIGSLSNLEIIDLNYNRLSGAIPSELGNLTNLTGLNFSVNRLTGSIPASFGQLVNLESLYLNQNLLVGSIPSELGQITSLKNLFLFTNNLSGTIPSTLANLSNLEILFLADNDLTGFIPSELSQLSNLTELRLHLNQLSGNIPPELGQITGLKVLYLNDNQLSGNVPSTLGSLSGLQYLHLMNNQLSGAIPSDLDQISTLIDVRIHQNEYVFNDLSTDFIALSNKLTTFNYSPQAKVDEIETLSVVENGSITLSSTALTSANNSYQWYKDGAIIPGATAKDLVLANATAADAGVYHFTATNSVVTDLTLERNPITLTITEDTCGVSEAEKQALIDLYNSTDGANWTNNTNWLTDAPVCDWYGVTVENSVITQLNIPSNNLIGPIPISIRNLTNLIRLDLNVNQLNGQIPKELGELTSLSILELRINMLEGTIPQELGSISNLKRLNVAGNRLTGEIPEELGNLTNLTSLNLSSNVLVGEIPSSLGNLLDLYELLLARNQLNGSIPESIGNLPVKFLRLNDNNLSGDIPQSISDKVLSDSLDNFSFDINNFVFGDFEEQFQIYQSNLRSFSYSPQAKIDESETVSVVENGSITLSSTALTSANNSYQWYKDGAIIPGATNKDLVISTATAVDGGVYHFTATNSVVTDLTLERNPITLTITEDTCGVSEAEKQALIDLYNSTDGANWTDNTNWLTDAPVCDWYGVTVVDGKVEIVKLPNNNLVGVLELTISNLGNLKELTLNSNRGLSGTLPSSLGTMTNLGKLNLSSCDFSGTIPIEITNLVNLEELYLGYNNFSGTIPQNVDLLTNLRVLALNTNQLEGTIPSEISNLLNLETLDLFGNELQGPIPTSIINLRNLKHLRLYSNQLDGAIPNQIGDLVNLEELQLGNNQLTGTIPETFTSLLNLKRFNILNNEIEGEIPSDIGNLVLLQELVLAGNNINGNVPTSISQLQELSNLNIWSNNLSGTIPSGITSLANLRFFLFYNNNFVFSDFENEHLVYNNQITNQYNYSPQAKVDQTETLSVAENGTITLSSTALTSANNSYQWYKDGAIIPGATNKDLVISTATAVDAGVYHFTATNSIVTGLTLERNPITLTITEDTCGVSEAEKQALIDLYNSTDGANWTDNTNWLTDAPVCDWFGIGVNNGNVVSISLSLNNLKGTLPTSLNNLPSLSSLYLQNNLLEGNIPPEIGELSSLRFLILHSNNFSGSIPPQLGNLASLLDLILYSNNLTGPIPAELGQLSSLRDLNLLRNNLSGTIPSELGNLSGTLFRINVSQNQYLSGKIPSSLLNLSGLQILRYNNNSFVFSDIEDDFDNFSTKLQTYAYAPQAKVDETETLSIVENGTITLSSTALTSTNNSYQWYKDGAIIPGATNKDLVISNAIAVDSGVYHFTATNSVVTDLTLERNPITLTITEDTCGVSEAEKQALIDLYNSTDGANWTNNTNWLTDTPVCDWYGVVVEDNKVTRLLLQSNNMVGEIPVSIGNLISIEILSFQSNNLSGVIPNEIGDLQDLLFINFFENNLSGSIPQTIGNLIKLKGLRLYSNELSGVIPSEIGNLTVLENLELYKNELSGSLPVTIGSLINLEVMDLEGNNLDGSIPTAISSLKKLERLRLSNNRFTGIIPEEVSTLNSLVSLSLANNQFTGSLPSALESLQQLQSLDVRQNKLSGKLPSNIENMLFINVVRIDDNEFVFSGLEEDFTNYQTVLNSNGFSYSPQAKVDQEETIEVQIGGSVTLSTTQLTSSNNTYTWYKGTDELIQTTLPQITIDNITAADLGEYYFTATNSIVTGLTLERNKITLVLGNPDSEDCDILEGVVDGSFQDCALVAGSTLTSSYNNNIQCGSWEPLGAGEGNPIDPNAVPSTWIVDLSGSAGLNPVISTEVRQSPDGGIFASALVTHGRGSSNVIKSQGFKTTLNNLEIGATYTVSFYQSHGGGFDTLGNFTVPNIENVLANWRVFFGNEVKNSDLIPIQSMADISSAPVWEKQEITFVPTETEQELSFVSFGSLINVIETVFYYNLLIDGIKVTKVGEDCTNDISEQRFCGEYETLPTVGDLVSPIPNTNVTWYASESVNDVLLPATVLSDNTVYWAGSIADNSLPRVGVRVILENTFPTGPTTQVFEATNNPTVADLQVSGTNIQWYLSEVGGSPLSSTTSLSNNTRYYASENNGLCRLEVLVTVNTSGGGEDCDVLEGLVDGSFQDCALVAGATTESDPNNNIGCSNWEPFNGLSGPSTWIVDLSEEEDNPDLGDPDIIILPGDGDVVQMSNLVRQSPDGGIFASGLVSYKISTGEGQGFKTTLTNLEPGTEYTISFYQSHGGSFNDPFGLSIFADTKWQVVFGAETKVSNAIAVSPITDISATPTWEKVEMIFIPTSTEQEISFSTIGVLNADRPTPDIISYHLLIDGIKVTKEGEDCTNDIAEQEFCLSEGIPTINDLASPFPNSIAWFENETGGAPLPSVQQITETVVLWAEGNSSNPRVAVRIVIKEGEDCYENLVQEFCADEGIPTINDLASPFPNSIAWFENESGGAPLPAGQQITETVTLWAEGNSSNPRVEVQIIIVENCSGIVIQRFCILNGDITIGDLQSPFSDSEANWFLTELDKALILPEYVIPESGVYWAESIENPSLPRIPINVILDDQIPFGDTTQIFDEVDGPTVADLQATGTNIQWYLSENGEIPLTSTTPLIPNNYYYAATGDSACRLKVLVRFNTIDNCNILTAFADGSFEECFGEASGLGHNHNVTCGNWFNGAGTADTWRSPYSVSHTGIAQNLASSPDGGIFAGAIARAIGINELESFYTNLTSLKIGETYRIEFYQSNATGRFDANEMREEARWKVLFGNEIKYSEYMQVTENPVWQKSTLEFVATAEDLRLEFVASSANRTESTSYVYMLIDGIKFSQITGDGTECPDDIIYETQSFCTMANYPTVADLLGPDGVTDPIWYSSEEGGVQFSPDDFLVSGGPFTPVVEVYWAESSQYEGRKPVRVILDEGIPVGSGIQVFEIGSNPTIADLEVTGNNVLWYDTPTSQEPLPTTTPLQHLEDYYAAHNGLECRLAVDVRIETSAPEVEGVQIFCESDNPTVADLIVFPTEPTYTTAWYSTPTGGTPLANSVALVDGTIYYVSQNDGNAESESRASVFVIVRSVPAPTGPTQQTVYTNDTATVSDLIAYGFGIVWYDGDGVILSPDEPLEEGGIYYASQTDFSGQCTSADRLAVQVSISPELPPEYFSCEKFRPQPGDRYVVSGWVRESGVTITSTDTKSFTEINDKFIELLNHLRDLIIRQTPVPKVYVPSPEDRNYDELVPYINTTGIDNLTIYNLQPVKENQDGFNRTVGFSFSFDQEGNTSFTYMNPVNVYEWGTSFYRYPMVNVNQVSESGEITGPMEINFDRLTNCSTGVCLETSFRYRFNANGVTPINYRSTNNYRVSNIIKETVDFNTYVPNPEYQAMDYANSLLEITYTDREGKELPEGATISFRPQGNIIDGWQRISADFTIPNNAEYMTVSLKSEDNNLNVYFDDIRFHPFDSNMKTFVYDPETQRLQSELDENNYSTFYEYDIEGGLIRVKKETERGVYTIQETRSGNSKLNNND